MHAYTHTHRIISVMVKWPQGVDCSLKAAQKTLKENETESLRGREEERVCVRVCVCGRDKERCQSLFDED